MWIDLSVDLREEFTWMTKQLFLYVTVDFETPDNRFNQMVMWSHIITSKASRCKPT
jgi:signal peptidase complex subunit 3